METITVENVVQWIILLGGISTLWFRGQQHSAKVAEVAKFKQRTEDKLAMAEEHRKISSEEHREIAKKMDDLRTDLHSLDKHVVRMSERVEQWMKKNGHS